MSTTPQQAYRKIVAYLRKHGVEFYVVRMQKLRGVAYLDFDVVALDPRNQLLSSLVHEVLHLAYRKWTEGQVLAMEKRIMAHITERQSRFLLGVLVSRMTTVTKPSKSVEDRLNAS